MIAPMLTAFIESFGTRGILVIVSVIFALFIVIPLIFVAFAIRKAKGNAEKDYTPYHLMEPEERLLMLQALRTKELISDEELEKKRKNIMRELHEVKETQSEKRSEEPSPTPPRQNTSPQP